MNGEWSLSPYYPYPSGEVSLTVQSQEASATIEEGRYYTAVYNGKEVELFTDPLLENRLKAVFVAYNLNADQAINITVGEKNVPVFTNIAAGELKSREINAVKIGFTVSHEGDNLASTSPEILQRGEFYSLFVMGNKAALYKAEIDTSL